MGPRTLTLLSVLVAALAGCGDAGRSGDGPGTVEPNAQASTSVASGAGDPSPTAVTGRVRVPSVIGLRGREARTVIRAAGLRPDARIVTTSSCASSGVMTQLPAAGAARPRGAEVVLELNADGMGPCGLGLPRAAPAAERAARAFVAFARGRRPAATLASRVALYLGDRLVRTSPAGPLAPPDGWDACPQEGHYAARTCPFSAVRSVQRWPAEARLAFTSERAEHSCLHERSEPDELAHLTRVTITPDEDLDCTTHWSVELFLDDEQRVAAANVLWAEP